MPTDPFDTQFLYRNTPTTLRAVYEALDAHAGLTLWGRHDLRDASDTGRIHYEYGPLHGAVAVGSLTGGIPRSALEQTDCRLRVHQGRRDFEDDQLQIEGAACSHHVAVTAHLYNALPTRPVMVCSTSPTFESGTSPLPDAQNGGRAYPRAYITWFDIYAPAEVETIGRDPLRSAPAPRVEEGDDGSVMIISKHPLDASDDALSAVSDHLGIPTWLDVLYGTHGREDTA